MYETDEQVEKILGQGRISNGRIEWETPGAWKMRLGFFVVIGGIVIGSMLMSRLQQDWIWGVPFVLIYFQFWVPYFIWKVRIDPAQLHRFL